jgi:hypothetical protein
VYVNRANQNTTKYADGVNQVNRETGDRMAAIFKQQGKEAADAAHAAGTSIVGRKSALGLNNQATRVQFSADVARRRDNEGAAIDSARLQVIFAIISRVGAKRAQDIEKGMEMRC